MAVEPARVQLRPSELSLLSVKTISSGLSA
jgi:hypothetical protein